MTGFRTDSTPCSTPGCIGHFHLCRFRDARPAQVPGQLELDAEPESERPRLRVVKGGAA